MNTLQSMLHAETMDTELNNTLFTNMNGEPCSVAQTVMMEIRRELDTYDEVDVPAYELHNLNGHYFKNKLNEDSQEVLALMIEAERREGYWIAGVMDDFGDTIVECVTTEQDFHISCMGEIAPTEQQHFLRGPNAWDKEHCEMMEWEDHSQRYNQ